jgi:hypothetical protein
LGDPHCECDPSFADLYRVAGDRQAQDEIRAAQSGNHCFRLEADPWACKECRYSPYNGPNGPVYEAVDRAMERNPNLLDEAFRLQAAVDARLIGPELTSEELEILTVMRRDQPVLEAKLRADLIAVSVSKMFSSEQSQ